MESIKLEMAKSKIFWMIFVILNGFAIVLMVATLAAPDWVEVDDSKYELHFKGSLYGLIETSYAFRKWENGEYKGTEDDWCDLKDNYTGDIAGFYAAGCTLFGTLATFGTVFVSFEVLSIVYAFANIAGLALFFINLDLLWLSFGSMIASNLWHLVGFISFVVSNSVMFSGDCDTFRDKDEPQDLCALSGPVLALFLSLFMLVCGILQCLFIGFYYKKKRYLGVPMWKIKIGDIEEPNRGGKADQNVHEQD